MLTVLRQDNLAFPDIHSALEEPNGLLAVGGDLSEERLLCAYRQGIFPWYEDEQPILWWSPDPRMVLFPRELHVSRSLRKILNKAPFRITVNQAFAQVIEHCAASRHYAEGTWITPAIKAAYGRLHQQGYAHSVEAWSGETLVGGLYGLSLGQIFFGESMFSLADNASKIAFTHLVKQLDAWDYGLIDCQVSSAHLASLGARDISRIEFQRWLPQRSVSGRADPRWQQVSTLDGVFQVSTGNSR